MITSSKAEKPDHGKPFLERGKLIYEGSFLLKITQNVNSEISIMIMIHI